MPRYKLRTLLIVLAIGPPMVLAAPWLCWQFYREYSAKRAIDEFFSVPVRPKKEPAIYEHIGLQKHPPGHKQSSTDNHE